MILSADRLVSIYLFLFPCPCSHSLAANNLSGEYQTSMERAQFSSIPSGRLLLADGRRSRRRLKGYKLISLLSRSTEI